MLVDSVHIRYSLAWMNLGLVALIPVLVTLIQLRAAIGARSFDSSCPAFITAAEEFPSILHAYALQEVQVATDNLHRGLLVGIGALEGILVWFIGIYKSTYRCLLGLAVNGAISAVSAVAAPVQSIAENILQGIRPTETAASTTTAPTSWMNGLTTIQEKIQVWANGTSDPLEELVSAPFEAAKSQIDRELGSYRPPPLPATETFAKVNTCDYPTALEDALHSAQSKLLFLVNMLLAVVVLLLIVAILVQILSIRSRRRITQRWTYQTVRDIEAHKGSDSIALTQKLRYLGLAYQRPWLAWMVQRWSLPIKSWLDSSWIHAFAHPIALYCLMAGAAGLFFTWLMGEMTIGVQDQLQNIVQTTMQQHLPGNDTGSMAVVDGQLTALNTWLAEVETDLNKHAFGTIQSIALTANTVLGVVTEHISGLLTNTLGGTLFEAPMRDVLDCLLTNKIDKIEQGLAWISEKSHVRLTQLDSSQVRRILLGDVLLQGFKQPINDIHASLGKRINDIIQVHQAFYTILLLLWCASIIIMIVVHLGAYLRRKIIK